MKKTYISHNNLFLLLANQSNFSYAVLSRVNESRPVNQDSSSMEILESAMYIAIGFVPTLLAMEASWTSGRKKSGLEKIKIKKAAVTPNKIDIL